MENGNVINLKDFEQNEIPLKQRSFEDSIDTFLSLFDADLLLIWMNKFRHGFHFRSTSCPVLHIVLIISRGECMLRLKAKNSICYYDRTCMLFINPFIYISSFHDIFKTHKLKFYFQDSRFSHIILVCVTMNHLIFKQCTQLFYPIKCTFPDS